MFRRIGQHFGGELYNMKRVVHGIRKKILVSHTASGIFKDFPSETHVGLYHSWAVRPENLPTVLTTSAVSTDGIVMAFQHKTLDITGVQFHPESYMTEMGRQRCLRLPSSLLPHLYYCLPSFLSSCSVYFPSSSLLTCNFSLSR